MTDIDVRCPVGPQRLLARLLARGEQPHVAEGNVWEFACTDCARMLRKDGHNVLRVLHQYTITGKFIETIVVPR